MKEPFQATSALVTVTGRKLRSFKWKNTEFCFVSVIQPSPFTLGYFINTLYVIPWHKHGPKLASHSNNLGLLTIIIISQLFRFTTRGYLNSLLRGSHKPKGLYLLDSGSFGFLRQIINHVVWTNFQSLNY